MSLKKKDAFDFRMLFMKVQGILLYIYVSNVWISQLPFEINWVEDNNLVQAIRWT